MKMNFLAFIEADVQAIGDVEEGKSGGTMRSKIYPIRQHILRMWYRIYCHVF